MEHPLRHLTRCLAALAAIALVLAPAGAADKKDTRPVLDPPPPAQPQRMTVTRGSKVDVPLRIFGRQSEQLRYLIKTPPAHGKLSEPRIISAEVSAVTYEPPEDLAVTADRFTFSVQNHAGVSAPVEVTISITDLPAQLAVPYKVQFGELLAGETATRDIEVSNHGGGMIEGEVQVEPPFKVEGRSKYRLGAGEYAYFKITFAPTEGGQFRREVRYTSHPEFISSLVGDAQMPISAEPGKIELQVSGDSAVRNGVFEIVNRTGEERTFQLDGGKRLIVPESVTVAPNARTTVAVKTNAEDVLTLDGEVKVESTGFSLRIPVKAATVGPILQMAQKNLTLGRIDAARGGQAAVELVNVGGTVAKVTGQIGVPFALPQPTFNLMPGEKKQVALSVKPAEAQHYRAWLKFKAGSSTAEVEVEADLAGDSPQGRAARSARAAKAAPAPVEPTEEKPWTPDLNIAKSIRIIDVYPTRAKIEWPALLNGAKNYKAERLMLTRDSAGALRNAWIDIPKTTFVQQGELWTASMTDLEPGQSQTIRLVPLDGAGKPSGSLFRVDFLTPAQRQIPKPSLMSWLFIGLAICGGILVWKRFRNSSSPAPIRGF